MTRQGRLIIPLADAPCAACGRPALALALTPCGQRTTLHVRSGWLVECPLPSLNLPIRHRIRRRRRW